jgi:hypothetical protein
MWAGGEVSWPRRADGKGLNLLRVGQEVRETTRLLSAESKVIKKTGEEMIVVGLEKVFENEDGVAVVDKRYEAVNCCLTSSKADVPLTETGYSVRR